MVGGHIRLETETLDLECGRRRYEVPWLRKVALKERFDMALCYIRPKATIQVIINFNFPRNDKTNSSLRWSAKKCTESKRYICQLTQTKSKKQNVQSNGNNPGNTWINNRVGSSAPGHLSKSFTYQFLFTVSIILFLYYY